MAIIKASPQSKNILVVDDDETIREFLEILLGSEGFNIKCVASGQEGLKWSKADAFRRIDLMVLDLMLPDLSGFSIIKEMQAAAYNKFPVVVITAKALDKEAERMIRDEVNVRELLRKPFSNHLLVSKIHSLLGTQPRREKERSDSAGGDFNWGVKD